MRLNFSHGSPEDHARAAETVREIATELDRGVAILGDLQGPKIRVSRFQNDYVDLEKGQSFCLDAGMGIDEGDINAVGIDYHDLPADCVADDVLLLDDGRIVLKVREVDGQRILCEVVVGGTLSNNKGINRQGGGLSAPALTDKDIADIKLAAKIGVHYLAVSFPRCAEDIDRARKLMEEAGGDAGIVAKIERAEAVEHETLDAIINASDAVMVARGDLGVEIGDAELVGIQKHIINRARALNKVVITATQMMESMINSPLPTRAEVMDVANSVFDGTDAVMLSAETAAGNYPIETVQAVVRIIEGAERDPSTRTSSHRLNQEFKNINSAIAMGAMYMANHLGLVRAIICMTKSGYTPLLMSRINSGLPIFALSRYMRTRSKVALYRGVKTIPFDSPDEGALVNVQAIRELKSKGFLETGDIVIITAGDTDDLQGGTNTIKLFEVE